MACEVASGLTAEGVPVRFEAGFVYRRGSLLARLVSLLPAQSGARAQRVLMRRHDPRIEDRSVHLYPWPELAYVASRQLGVPEPMQARALLWRHDRFDRHVARVVRRTGTPLVIAHDGQALATFRAAKQVGAISVLNQATGFVREAMLIYREEATLCPDFEESLSTHLPLSVCDSMAVEALEADHVLAPSAYVRDTLLRLGVAAERIALLPYGVDIARFRPSARPVEAPFRVLFVGLISQKKGVKYLLEAARRAGLAPGSLILAGGVVGAGSGLAPYRNLFRHVPHVPYGDVHRLYQDADVFVFPSLHEGSAFANLEAMASGIPVITTPNAGSMVRDGVDGFIVPIRDAGAIAEKLDLLRRDPERRRAMGAAARARAEEFSWARHRRELARLVRSWARI
jgi:alpha-maltose-1-phosphate synthase